jgi:hypothetical protein
MILTIEISSGDESRVRAAYGAAGTPATDTELTSAIKHWLGTNTIEYEKQKAWAEYQSPPLGLMA